MSVFTSFISTTAVAPLGCDSSRRSTSSPKLNLLSWAIFGFVVAITWSPQFSVLMRGVVRGTVEKVQNVISSDVKDLRQALVAREVPLPPVGDVKGGASTDVMDETILPQGPDQSSEVSSFSFEKELTIGKEEEHPDDDVSCVSSPYWYFQGDFVLAMFYLVKITLWAHYVVQSGCVGANFVLFLV